jgi:BON domain
MPDDRDPSSYDDIVRRTVVDPLGLRPSREEELLARHRAGVITEHLPHPLSEAEREALARADAALAADPALDLSDVKLAIDGRELIVTGTVPGPATLARIEDVALEVEGIDRIDNQLIVRGPR